MKHEGKFGPSRLSRIWITLIDLPEIVVPRVCRQCNPANCEQNCPVNAIVRDPETSILMVKEEECTGCGVCVDVCPFDAVRLHPEKRVALLCDLCEGKPACIKYCVSGAIRISAVPGKGVEEAKKLAKIWLEGVTSQTQGGESL